MTRSWFRRHFHELWRYYPQIAKRTDDLAAPWFVELWTLVPTPVKARQLRKSRIEQLLKQHRIRRIDAEAVLCTLREPAIKVAEGVTEAASVHMRSLIARLQLVNRELREAERQLDKICTKWAAAWYAKQEDARPAHRAGSGRRTARAG